jgi:hypothetical protein
MPDKPPSGWRISMMLADHAQAVLGKLYITGGGWSITSPAPTPRAVAAKIDIPWEEANHKHTLKLELVDEDGNIVQLPGPAGPQAFVINAPFEVGRPPGLKPGTILDLVFAINLGPIPLEPGKRYGFRLSIEGTDATQTYVFSVREAPSQIVPGQPIPPPGAS